MRGSSPLVVRCEFFIIHSNTTLLVNIATTVTKLKSPDTDEFTFRPVLHLTRSAVCLQYQCLCHVQSLPWLYLEEGRFS